MPRNYVKQSDRRSWSEDNLIAALHAADEENMSCNRASLLYEIPEPTLRRYLKKRRDNVELPIHGGRFRVTFNHEQERQFVEYIKDLHCRAFGLTAMDCQKLAFEFAERNNIHHRFNQEAKAAGRDWLISFM